MTPPIGFSAFSFRSLSQGLVPHPLLAIAPRLGVSLRSLDDFRGLQGTVSSLLRRQEILPFLTPPQIEGLDRFSKLGLFPVILDSRTLESLSLLAELREQFDGVPLFVRERKLPHEGGDLRGSALFKPHGFFEVVDPGFLPFAAPAGSHDAPASASLMPSFSHAPRDRGGSRKGLHLEGVSQLPPPNPKYGPESLRDDLRVARAYLGARNRLSPTPHVPQRPGRLQKVLVNNRGEIAQRFFIELKRLGIPSVAVVTDEDRGNSWCQEATEVVYIGEATHHTNRPLIIEAARATGANAIYPGYGLLSEDVPFVQAIDTVNTWGETKIIFMGPSARTIGDVGLKDKARDLAEQHGVKLFDGSKVIQDEEHGRAEARRIGYPVLLKLSAGGGGKGMNIVNSEQELGPKVRATQDMGSKLYNDGRFFMERYLPNPEHIEVQLFGNRGCGVRKCAIQREHQKLIEETALLSDQVQQQFLSYAETMARASDYEEAGAGTVEFLRDGDAIGFLEVNTRLQVEHPVTEETVGLNLAKLQILHFDDQGSQVKNYLDRAERNLFKPLQHAIELRILAEDPGRGFAPSTGLITSMSLPRFKGVRCDFGFKGGDTISGSFDSMIGKLIITGDTREEALSRARAALEQLDVKGIKTNVDYLRRILDVPEFIDGTYNNNFVKNHPELLQSPDDPASDEVMSVAAAFSRYFTARKSVGQKLFDQGQGGLANQVAKRELGEILNVFYLRSEGRDYEVAFVQRDDIHFGVTLNGSFRYEVRVEEVSPRRFDLKIGTESYPFSIDEQALATVVRIPDRQRVVRSHEVQFFTPEQLANGQRQYAEVTAPFNAKFVRLGDTARGPGGNQRLKPGDHVEKGEVIIVLESMKTERSLTAPVSGCIEEIINEGNEELGKGLVKGFTIDGKILGCDISEGTSLFKIVPDQADEIPKIAFEPRPIPAGQNGELLKNDREWREASIRLDMDLLLARMRGHEVPASVYQTSLKNVQDKPLLLPAEITTFDLVSFTKMMLEVLSDLDSVFVRHASSSRHVSHYGRLRFLVDRWMDYNVQLPRNTREILGRLVADGVTDFDRRNPQKRAKLEQAVINLTRAEKRLGESISSMEAVLDLVLASAVDQDIQWAEITPLLVQFIREHDNAEAMVVKQKCRALLKRIDPASELWVDLPPVASIHEETFRSFLKDPFYILGASGSEERARETAKLKASLTEGIPLASYLANFGQNLSVSAMTELLRFKEMADAKVLYSPFQDTRILRVAGWYMVQADIRGGVQIKNHGTASAPAIEEAVIEASHLLAMYQALDPATENSRMQIVADTKRIAYRLSGIGNNGELNERKIREITMRVLSFTHSLRIEKTAVLINTDDVISISRQGRELVVKSSKRASPMRAVRLASPSPVDAELIKQGKWPVARWNESIFDEPAGVKEILVPFVDNQRQRVESRLFVGSLDHQPALVYYKDPTAPARGATGDLEGLKKFAADYLAYVIFKNPLIELNDGSGANVRQGMIALLRAAEGFAANTLTSGLSTPEKFLRYLRHINDPVLEKIVKALNETYAPGRTIDEIFSEIRDPLTTISVQLGSGSGLDVYGSSQTAIQIQKEAENVFRVLTGDKVNSAATGEQSTNEDMGGARMMAALTGTVDVLSRRNEEVARHIRQAVDLARVRIPEQFTPIQRSSPTADTAVSDFEHDAITPRDLFDNVDGGEPWEMKEGYLGSGAVYSGLASLSGQTVQILAARNHYGIGSITSLTRTWEGLLQAEKMGLPQILVSGKRWIGTGHDHDPSVVALKRNLMASLTRRVMPRLLIVTNPEGLRQPEIMAHVDAVIYVRPQDQKLSSTDEEAVRRLATCSVGSFKEAMDRASFLVWLMELNRRGQRGRIGSSYDPQNRPTDKVASMLKSGGWNTAEVIRDLVDDGVFVEFEPEAHDRQTGPSLITGLALLNGHVTGVLADTDAADYEGTEKFRRFVEFCNRHRIDILPIPNAGGFRPGVKQERGRIQQVGARSLDTNSLGDTAVGRLDIQGYGGHVIHRFMRTLRPGIRGASLASAQMAVMGPEAAFNLFVGFRYESCVKAQKWDEANRILDKFSEKYNVSLTPEQQAQLEDIQDPAVLIQTRFLMLKDRFQLSSKENARADHDALNVGLVDAIVEDARDARAKVILIMEQAREAAASAFRNKADSVDQRESLAMHVVKNLEAMGIRARMMIPNWRASSDTFRIQVADRPERFRPEWLAALVRHSQGQPNKFLGDLDQLSAQPEGQREVWLENYERLETAGATARFLQEGLVQGGGQVFGIPVEELGGEAQARSVLAFLERLSQGPRGGGEDHN